MAIQPIDLQTIYLQLDKVGKIQVEAQLASQTAKEQGRLKNIREAEEKLTTIHKTEAGDEITGKIHEKNSSSDPSSQQKSTNDETNTITEEPKEPEKEIIRDPALGSHIDISG